MADQSPVLPSDQTLVELQREVQRKLGACLICVQQFEHLMKVMLTGRTAEGMADEIEKTRLKTLTEVKIKTLGMLVNEFCGDLVISFKPAKVEEIEDDKSMNRGLEAPWFSYQYARQMSPERHQQTRKSLIELKESRNQLVHHFLELFSLADENSCRLAGAYLDVSYATFNHHYLQLEEWVASMERTRSLLISFMETQMYEDLIVNGINTEAR